MDFSLTARVGFISVPISGTVVVDDVNVTVNCELPALVKQFIGEDKIRAGLDRRVRGHAERSEPTNRSSCPNGVMCAWARAAAC